MKPGLEQTLRDLSIRGDIIKTMHRAMTGAGREPDVTGFALHGDDASDPVLGRLVARGLHDELKGSAYAVVEGVDGRDASSPLLGPGDDGRRQARRDRRGPRSMRTRTDGSALSLATRSDLTDRGAGHRARRDLDRPAASCP